MTRHPPPPDLLHERLLRTALLRRIGTPRVKTAARRQIDRTRNLAGEQLGILAAPGRIRSRNRIDQEPCIGMQRPEEHLLGFTAFAELPKEHDADPVCDIPDDGEIMV